MTLSNKQVIIVLAVLCFGAYANALFYPFVHDDIAFIQENPQINDWNNLSQYFLHYSSLFGSASVINAYYRPLLEILYKIQYLTFGEQAYLYHLFNIIVHWINGCLVFFIISYLTKKKKIALCVSTFFLIHPVQGESVAYISGVSDLMFSFFCLSSFWAYLWAQEKSGTLKRWLKGGSIFLFALGLFAKEQAVVLPFVILAYEWCFRRAKQQKADYVTIGGLLCVFFGYVLLRKFLLGGVLPPLMDNKQELVLRILALPRLILMYLRFAVFPAGLHFYRTVNVLKPFLVPFAIFGILLAVIFYVILKAPKPRKPILIFSILWFILVLLPVLNIIPIVTEYSLLWTPEHFLYLPLVGFLLFICSIGDMLVEKLSLRKQTAISGGFYLCITATLLILTLAQNTQWQSEIALFERSVKYEQHTGRVHMVLAKVYLKNKRPKAAIYEYKKALSIIEHYYQKTKASQAHPFYRKLLIEIHEGLAQSYRIEGKMMAAIKEYMRILELNPSLGEAYNNIGSLYLAQNNIGEAETYFRKALSYDANNVHALSNLGVCAISQGKKEEAMNFFEQAVRIDPDFHAGQRNLRLLKESLAQ